MCKSDSIFFINKIVHYLNYYLNEIYFLIRFIIKKNWTYLAQKNSQPGSKIDAILGLS